MQLRAFEAYKSAIQENRFRIKFPGELPAEQCEPQLLKERLDPEQALRSSCFRLTATPGSPARIVKMWEQQPDLDELSKFAKAADNPDALVDWEDELVLQRVADDLNLLFNQEERGLDEKLVVPYHSVSVRLLKRSDPDLAGQWNHFTGPVVS